MNTRKIGNVFLKKSPFWKKNLFDTLIKITTLTYAAFVFTGEKSLMILFQQTIRNPTHTLWWQVYNQLRVMIIAQQLFPHKRSSLINFFSGIKSRFLRSKTKAINGLYVMIWQMSIFKYLFVQSDAYFSTCLGKIGKCSHLEWSKICIFSLLPQRSIQFGLCNGTFLVERDCIFLYVLVTSH